MKKQNRSISIQKDEYSFQHQKELNDYQQQIRELLAEKEAKQKENDKLISQNRQQNPYLNSSIDQKTQRIKKSRLSKKYSRNYLIYFVNQETTMRFPQLKITTIEKKWIQCQFNQGFIIEQSIEFNTKEISGAMIDNFEYLVTWDLGNSKFSVRKIKGRSEQYQHKV